MLFNSIAFFVFFPIVVAAFFATPLRLRWVVLLGASWFFYAWWKPQYLVLLILSTTVDFAMGRAMGRATATPKRRRLFLGVSLVTNLGLLFFFKYLGFFSKSFASVLAVAGLPSNIPTFDILLPVGISFYTFQTVGYGIDVYRKTYEPEKHYGRFALFIAFFPHLVAGPIMRASVLLPQFRRDNDDDDDKSRFDFDRATSGLGWMLWGFFKKVVIADRAAHFVNAVYDDPAGFQGITIIVATYVFAFQIYCDFSGYSDIAFGAAKILGFDLVQNFNRPYTSGSIVDFWRRWHISLSTWFIDYVYAPLGGNRKGRARQAFNVAIVFMLSGLWHGASWTFVLWGAFHGALVIVTTFIVRAAKHSGRFAAGSVRPLLLIPVRAVAVLVTFHLVCFGWLLFRARDLGHVQKLLARLPVRSPIPVLYELASVGPAPVDAMTVDLGILALSTVVLLLVEEAIHGPHSLALANRLPKPARTFVFAALTVWVLVAAVQTHSPFIYFQF